MTALRFIATTIIVLLLAVLAIYFALSRGEKKGSAEEKPVTVAEQSTAKTAIEGFTGKSAVQMGKKARQKIDVVDAKRNEDLKELEMEGR